MDKPITLDLADEFAKLIAKEINQKYKENSTIENVIFHLVENGIIPTSRARNYMIVKDYHRYMTDTTGKLIDFCQDSEVKYDLTSRQIHNIIGKTFKKIFIDNHIQSKEPVE